MSKVFVLDSEKRPLEPIHPGCARHLLTGKKAAVYRRFPFTLILLRAVKEPAPTPLRLKIDPGSKTTGLALVNDATGEVVFAAEVEHRGSEIKKSLDSRRAIRRSRRQRHTRYRQPRWRNRRSKFRARELQDRLWLPPSLESRLTNIVTWVQRLRKLASIAALSQELVKFDTQLMQNAEISGISYQQGELQGFEIREYLLEKWQRRCSYCGIQQVPFQIEHIRARANGGTDRVSNLTLSCEACNIAKGTQRVEVFLANRPEVLTRILAHAKAPLRDAAAVNATRWALYERLQATDLPLETGSGSLTKYNRAVRNLPKVHWLDAACTGRSTPAYLETGQIVPLLIQATGHGNRQMCGVKKGFPIRHRKRQKVHHGYQTGDLARAVVPAGKKAGTYVGRVLTRASGSFDLATKTGRVEGISYRYCQPLHRNDGYTYAKGVRLDLAGFTTHSLQPKRNGHSSPD